MEIQTAAFRLLFLSVCFELVAYGFMHNLNNSAANGLYDSDTICFDTAFFNSVVFKLLFRPISYEWSLDLKKR